MPQMDGNPWKLDLDYETYFFGPIELMRDIARQVGATAVIAPNTVLEIEQLRDLELKGVPDLDCLRCLDDKSGIDELCSYLAGLVAMMSRPTFAVFAALPPVPGKNGQWAVAGTLPTSPAFSPVALPAQPAAAASPVPAAMLTSCPPRASFTAAPLTVTLSLRRSSSQ